MIPLTHLPQKNFQVDNEVKDKGQFNMTDCTFPLPTPRLLSMKENSGKKVLKTKAAQKDPLDSPSQKNLPGGQRDQGHGEVLHVQEEVY